MWVYFLISSLVIALDQVVKYWTVQNFELGEQLSIIPNVFSLTYIQNDGAAWSMLAGKMTFFVIVTVLAVVGVTYLMIRERHGNPWLLTGLSLILAGAIGNFIDRVRLNYVVDMFQTDFMNFPIFNVADVALVVGVGCVFIYALTDESMKESK